MSLMLRMLSHVEKFRALVPGHVTTMPMVLERDFEAVERLLRLEEWPFVRSDLELGEAQPGETSYVAHCDGQFAAFFTSFMFGRIGYLDMFVIDQAFRGRSVARPLYFKVIEALQAHGSSGLVCHTTNDSARLVKLLGFKPGRTFTLRIRPPAAGGAGPGLEAGDGDRFAALDAEIFGLARPHWTGFLARDPRVDLVAYGDAMCALRPRIHDGIPGYSLDHLLAPSSESLAPMVDGIIARHGASSMLMAFVADGSPLDSILADRGFAVPEFFVPIGPLTEWREGDTGSVGMSPAVQTVLWL